MGREEEEGEKARSRKEGTGGCGARPKEVKFEVGKKSENPRARPFELWANRPSQYGDSSL